MTATRGALDPSAEHPGVGVARGGDVDGSAAGTSGDQADLLVVGGGLAGLSAALVAADAGRRVTLLEARPRLGGATTSFQRDGMWVDTGQHVFLRCCDHYRAFLRRLDVERFTHLQPRLDVGVQVAGGPRARLRRTRVPWPAPLHLAPALLGYQALPLGQRLRASLAAFALGRLDPRRPEVDGRSFGGWLSAHGQGERATEALWELLTVATLNAPAGEASLGLAAKVVRTGLLERADAGDIGWAEVPLGRLHGDAARAALTQRGATVRTGVKVRAIRRPAGTGPAGHRPARPGERGEAPGRGGQPAGGAWGVETDAGVLTARAVVLAVPPAAAADLLPPGAVADPGLFRSLGSAPIVNVHLVYDRPVLDEPFLAGVGTPVQWVFDRTASSGLGGSDGPGDRQYLAISLSAAAGWVDRPAAEIINIFVDEMRTLLPAAARAEVLTAFVTRERAATFRQAPGSLAARPGPATALPGLAIAGAWTDTGWPATMEGAVRSGLAAARVALIGSIPAGEAPAVGASTVGIPTVGIPAAGVAAAAADLTGTSTPTSTATGGRPV
jgi:squalene-associated FAD-dependent desaturase